MDDRYSDPLCDLEINIDLTLNKRGAIGDRFIPKAVCANLYDLYFAENTQSEN